MAPITRFHVRASSAALRPHLARTEALVESGRRWAWTSVDPGPVGIGGAPRVRLAALSARLGTEVAWLGYSAAADALHYVRWDHGELQRELAWGFLAPGGWDRVAGPPEPWEAARPGYNLLPVRLDVEETAFRIARHHRFAEPGQDTDPTDLFPIGWCAGDEDDDTEETTHPRGRCAECGALVRGPCPRCETLAVRTW